MVRPAFDRTRASFIHTGLVARWLLRFKRHHDLTLGYLLTRLMLKALMDSVQTWPEALVPIPSPMSQSLWRGLDHRQWLSRQLAGGLGQTRFHGCLRTTRWMKLQSGSTMAKRFANVRGGFELKAKGRARGAGMAPFESVALLDDRMVSGATAHQAARVLKDAGVSDVEVWVLARDNLLLDDGV